MRPGSFGIPPYVVPLVAPLLAPQLVNRPFQSARYSFAQQQATPIVNYKYCYR